MAARCKLLQVANSAGECELVSSDISVHEAGALTQEDDRPAAKRPKLKDREGDEEETEEEREEEEEEERKVREVDERGSDSHRVGKRRTKWELTAEQLQVSNLSGLPGQASIPMEHAPQCPSSVAIPQC